VNINDLSEILDINKNCVMLRYIRKPLMRQFRNVMSSRLNRILLQQKPILLCRTVRRLGSIVIPSSQATAPFMKHDVI
jgi:hypothetical protein